MVSEIHLISKRDLTKHQTVAVDLALPQLAPSSIRTRSALIGITTNQLSYAKLGEYLGWWNVWPVPLDLPAPYNNRDEWGIVPAWGFARVVESTIGTIPVGSLLYGYWPTSTHPVDLKLEEAEPKGHYREVNEYRQAPGKIYNHYNLFDESTTSEEFRAWFAVVYSIWGGGYVLNRYTFPSEFKPVHPLGEGAGEWSDEDGDLSSALVVSLSASSKTGRSFTWNLARNRKPDHGPLAVLQAASAPGSLPPAPKAGFEIKTVAYDDLVSQETLEWIVKLQPKRVVLVDFGGPSKVTEKFHDAITSALSGSATVTFLLVGGEPKISSPEETVALMQTRQKWGMVQLNTTAAIDAGKALEGPETFYKETEAAFERSLEDNIVGDLELHWGDGVGGSNGVEKAWEDIIKGTLPRKKAFAYKLE
ncbi:hypothetical protein CCHL11_09238 [Colletotrichum chlorophyti]|uniref:Uncharacterized protein n=1 Tax=Colletotrichum chlorophyti TaxID=708187 RepID=A0A1Q8RCA3_9PEZI|nr:hypothetical protein CCHL11_09238 [Colletotrichum chlorophyti]